jgi:hypothetical protein
MEESAKPMGFYRSQILPRCMARAMGNEGLGEHRERAFGAYQVECWNLDLVPA